MKKLFVILIICLLTYSSFCQYRHTKWYVRKNSIYFEALGNGVLFSINYERLFPLGKYTWLATRIGFTEAPDYDLIFHPMLPLEISGIFGKKHYFEFGAGTTLVLIFEEDSYQLYFFRVGYRYRADSGFLFRIAPMVIFTPEYTWLLPAWPWIGISIGYSF